MAAKLETITLADLQNDVRGLTMWYLKTLIDRGVDPHQTYKLGDADVHSVYWLTAHLAWSESYILIQALTGKKSEIPWLDHFSKDTGFEPEGALPEFGEVLKSMKEIHEEAQAIIRAMPLEELDATNHLGFGFGGDLTKRKMLYHWSRHEPFHAGQLGLICKANGIRMA